MSNITDEELHEAIRRLGAEEVKINEYGNELTQDNFVFVILSNAVEELIALRKEKLQVKRHIETLKERCGKQERWSLEKLYEEASHITDNYNWINKQRLISHASLAQKLQAQREILTELSESLKEENTTQQEQSGGQ